MQQGGDGRQEFENSATPNATPAKILFQILNFINLIFWDFKLYLDLKSKIVLEQAGEGGKIFGLVLHHWKNWQP